MAEFWNPTGPLTVEGIAQRADTSRPLLARRWRSEPGLMTAAIRASHSPQKRAFLCDLVHLTLPARGHDLGDCDAVHGDLHPGNTLISASGDPFIVDVEAVGRGHRAFDVATLLCAGYGLEAGPDVIKPLKAGCRSSSSTTAAA